MAQSKAAVRGQRKGKNVSIGDAPPPPISSESAASKVEGRGGPRDNIDKYPLWKYVTREDGTSTKGKGGGNVQWRCNFCHIAFKSTYFRVKAHLLALSGCGIGACKAVRLQKRKELEKESTVAKRRATALGPMDKIFQKERREELDLTIAFFYQNFISFNVGLSPLFIEMCRALTQGAPSGYVPPRSEKLRTTLLTKEKKEVQKMLEPIVASWPTFGVSIVSDGWTDPARHPIINFMVSSLNGPIFMKAVDTLGEYKDAQFIGELFIKVIEDVDVNSCVQIITDNAHVCKVAGMIVEAKYPQVFWTPCIVHLLNLALKSIASDVLWIGNIIEDAQHIRNFVQNHTNALTIYKDYTNLSLLKIADTWFASSFMMLKWLREVKTALGSMVIFEFWSFWRKTDQVASKRVKDTVLNDSWWGRVDLIIRIMDHIISLLRFADTDKPILGEVYEGWDSMIESVRSIIL
eukprot:PITA_32931